MNQVLQGNSQGKMNPETLVINWIIYCHTIFVVAMTLDCRTTFAARTDTCHREARRSVVIQ